MAVTDVGAELGDEPRTVTGDAIVPAPRRNLTASTIVEPGDSETYENVFTEPVYYRVQFLVDGAVPENDAGMIAFNPSDSNGGSRVFLAGKGYESGEFSWVVSSTDNPGNFER